MENEKVDFCRVKDLEAGNHFMINGVWRKVREVKLGKVMFYYLDGKGGGNISANSSQYVQVIRNPPIKISERLIDHDGKRSAKAKALKRSGKTAKEIADIFGYKSRGSVHYLLNKPDSN